MLSEILTDQMRERVSRAHARRNRMQFVSPFSCHLGWNGSPGSPATEPRGREDPARVTSQLAHCSETTSRPRWAGPCNGLIRGAAVTDQVAPSAQIRPSQLCTCFQMMQWMGPVYWPWKPRGKASKGITAPHTHLFLYESHLCPGG